MKWYSKYLPVYEKPFDSQMYEVCDLVRAKMAAFNNSSPLATVCVRGYNEERHLLACLWSLCESICSYPVEIIGVDNDSSDKTAEIFERCGVRYYTEKRHSPGWSWACGLSHVKGKYHINIDGDTMYPPRYIEKMISVLEKPGVVGVTSLWSYIPDVNHSKSGIAVFEFLRDNYLWLQHFKRPELVVRGMVFAYDADLGKKIGIRTDIKRGEDGSLALGLKNYGKIVFLRSRKARAVTGYGTLDRDGSFAMSFKTRAIKAVKGFGTFFTTKNDYKDEQSNLVK